MANSVAGRETSALMESITSGSSFGSSLQQLLSMTRLTMSVAGSNPLRAAQSRAYWSASTGFSVSSWTPASTMASTVFWASRRSAKATPKSTTITTHTMKNSRKNTKRKIVAPRCSEWRRNLHGAGAAAWRARARRDDLGRFGVGIYVQSQLLSVAVAGGTSSRESAQAPRRISLNGSQARKGLISL